MKKIYITLLIICLAILSTTNIVFAQSKDSTSSARLTPTPINEEIQNFKEKIASKVAELTKEQQKAISGFVTKTGNQLIIKNDDNMTYQVKIDDILTKIYKITTSGKTVIKLTDIKKNDYLIINGPSSDNSVTANYIFVDEHYLVNVGKISQVDKENFSIRVITADKETVNLDIETSTKQLMLDIKSQTPMTMGFSKIKEGDTVHFVVKKTTLVNESSYSAVKILVIPQEYFVK